MNTSKTSKESKDRSLEAYRVWQASPNIQNRLGLIMANRKYIYATALRHLDKTGWQVSSLDRDDLLQMCVSQAWMASTKLNPKMKYEKVMGYIATTICNYISAQIKYNRRQKRSAVLIQIDDRITQIAKPIDICEVITDLPLYKYQKELLYLKFALGYTDSKIGTIYKTSKQKINLELHKIYDKVRRSSLSR